LSLEVEEFAKTLGLGAAHRDFSLLGVVHAELVAGLEPWHYLSDVLDIDDEGAVGAPESFRVELVDELFEGAAVGVAFNAGGDDADLAVLNRGEAYFALVDEEKAVLGADHDLSGLYARGGLDLDLLLHQFQEGIEFSIAGGLRRGGDAGAGLFEGTGDTGAVKGLEEVIDGVHLEGADSVLVEGGGEDDLRTRELLVEELLDDGKAVEAGHLDVEEDEVWLVETYEVDGLDAVGALSEDFDAAGFFEEVDELLAGEGFVVDDDGGERSARMAVGNLRGDDGTVWHCWLTPNYQQARSRTSQGRPTRTSEKQDYVFRDQVYLRRTPRTLPWMATLAAGAYMGAISALEG
jgi:hypothetical protein